MKNDIVPFRDVIKWTLVAGLITGTLDATGAIVVHSADPVRMFQFISSGAFGSDVAYSGGWQTATAGVLFHYFIATTWCFLFFMLSTRARWIAEHRLLSGILYGIVIWLVMNLIVLKLSRINTRPIQLRGMAIGMSVLIVAIGIPVSYMAAWRMNKFRLREAGS